MDNRTFKIITLGCKVNQYESAYLRDSLLNMGWHNVSRESLADLSVINTCIVTNSASNQSRQAIRKAIRENPAGRVAAIGCYGQVFPEELSSIKGLDLIAGNTKKGQLPKILLNNSRANRPCVFSNKFEQKQDFEFLPIKSFLGRTRAFLKIQDGCESFCSYCIVPYSRGPIRSLDPDKVLHMIKALVAKAYKEIVLTGIHLGKYGAEMDHGEGLKDLLRRIRQERSPVRIRLSSLEPMEIDQELLDMIASEEWICKHLHIPLQSGDNWALKKMNRNYTSEEFASLIELIHHMMPTAAIGVDIMAGFPGEDSKAHNNSLSLIKDLPISYLHVFPFSPRKGTPASDFPGQVDKNVIKERTKELRDLGKIKRSEFQRLCLGREFSVLTEGWAFDKKNMMKGLSDNYLRVHFASSYLIKNSLVKVNIQDIGDDIVIGKMV